MHIRFWGTRGSIPTPGPTTVRYGGNTACVEVRDSGGTLLILDAGTGLRELGIALVAHNGTKPFDITLLVSHLHWDHIQGIPFFRPAYVPNSTMRILGPKQTQTMKELLGLGMDDPFFPVDLDDLPAKIEIGEMADGDERQVGPYRVRAASIVHPSPALAYRIEADGRALVYATDTEDFTSGRPNPVIPLATGADTLIHDAQYLQSDFKPTWGHSTIDAAIDIATQARVKRLILYHHDPDRNDDALDHIGRIAAHAGREKSAELEVVVAREGLELEV